MFWLGSEYASANDFEVSQISKIKLFRVKIPICFNRFVPTAPFLYLPKVSVFWCFQGVEKAGRGNKWGNTLLKSIDMGKLAWSELSRWLGKFRAKPINKTSSPNVKFASVSTIAYQCSNTFRRSTRTILEQVNVSGVLSLSKYFLNVKIFYQSNGPGPIISSFLCWVFLSCFFFLLLKERKSLSTYF